MTGMNSTGSPISRALGGLAGLVMGGIFGVLILIVAMLFTAEPLRFVRILPGMLAGAGAGVLLGLCFPRAFGKAFLYLLAFLISSL